MGYRDKLGTILINWIGLAVFYCAASFVFKREFKKGKKREWVILAGLKGYFQLIEMAAHKILSLRRNLHLGRHFEHSWVCACVCLCMRHTEQNNCAQGTSQRWDPVFKLDYTAKRKCERPQRSTDRGEALGFANRKKWESHFKNINKTVIFFRLPVLSWVSLSLTDTQRHMHPHQKL